MELSNRLSELRGRNDIVQDDMNSLVNSLNNVYIENCKQTFGTTAIKSKSHETNKNAKWFNKSCKIARKKFHNAKFLYKLRKTDRGKNDLNVCSKAYKKTLAEAHSKFKNTKIKEM